MIRHPGTMWLLGVLLMGPVAGLWACGDGVSGTDTVVGDTSLHDSAAPNDTHGVGDTDVSGPSGGSCGALQPVIRKHSDTDT